MNSFSINLLTQNLLACCLPESWIIKHLSGRRSYFSNDGTLIVTHDEQSEAFDIVQIIRTQRCVVESGARIHVSVFAEPSIAILHFCVRFHIDARKRLATFLVCHANLSVVVRRLYGERIRVIGGSFALALTDHFHEHVAVAKLGGQLGR